MSERGELVPELETEMPAEVLETTIEEIRAVGEELQDADITNASQESRSSLQSHLDELQAQLPALVLLIVGGAVSFTTDEPRMDALGHLTMLGACAKSIHTYYLRYGASENVLKGTHLLQDTIRRAAAFINQRPSERQANDYLKNVFAPPKE